MRKAVVENGSVVNVIECSRQGLNGLQLPLGQSLWDCSDYQVQIGDHFLDGVFTRDCAPVLPVFTQTDELREQNKLLDARIKAQGDRADFIDDCLAELAMRVYGA